MFRLLVLLLVVGVWAAPVGPRGDTKPHGRAAGKGPRTPGEGDGPNGEHKRPLAFAMMRSGLPRGQVVSWRMEYKNHPKSEETRLGLAMALFRMGECAEALDHFWALSDSTFFDAKAAAAAGQCAAREGYYQDAVFFDKIGLEKMPDNVRILELLAIHSDLAGDGPQMQRTFATLETLGKKGGDPSLYARVAVAVRHSDVDLVDANRNNWSAEGWSAADFVRFDAQLWLDLDDPLTASRLQPPKGPRSYGRHIFAEAFRRLGEADTAINWLSNDKARVAEGIAADAVEARAYTDVGDFAQAKEILAAYPEETDAEIQASRWYLAQAQGDAPGAQRWASAWRQVNPSPLRTLQQLIPITKRQ